MELVRGLLSMTILKGVLFVRSILGVITYRLEHAFQLQRAAQRGRA